MVCFSLCVCVCVCVLCLMSLHAACEISCGDVWCSMRVCVCESVVLSLCGVFAMYCVMLCALCILCDVWVCVLCAVVA